MAALQARRVPLNQLNRVNTPNDRQISIWLVIGDKLGDNAQARLVADSLALPYETKRLIPKPGFMRGKPRFKASLDHLDLASSDDLRPPWPDLVITVGRRHSMAALWIKKQSPGTKVVLLGRPRRWIEKFDLVITLPQYQIPQHDNVLRLSWPLMRIDKESVEQAGKDWSHNIRDMTRPITAVFVGGPTQPFRFDRTVARALIRDCKAAQQDQHGSLFFVTSPRTTPEIVTALEDNLPANARMYRWQKGLTDNPYKALLGLADRCIVTGDSISMMIEVADLAKPLAIFELPRHLRGKLWRDITKHLFTDNNTAVKPGVLSSLGKLLYKTGIIGFPRDLTSIHQSLINKGLATYLRHGFPTSTVALPSELSIIRKRINALISI